MPLPSTTDGLLQRNSTVRYTPKGPVFVDSSNLLSSGRPTPVAAYAIPLAAAAAALLIAGGLAIRHRGALRKERDKERRAIRLFEKLSRSSTISYQPACGAGDSSSTAPQPPHPIPLFMPMSLPSSSSMPQTSLSTGYPAACEPRQITRNPYACQGPIRVDHSVSGRPYSQSISNYTGRSTPTTPKRSVRTRNLSTASTCFSPSPSTNELGIARGIRDNSSRTASYLPPLSFSNSSSRGLFASRTCTLAKEPSVVTNECMTSQVLEDYFLSSRLDSESRAPLDPTRPCYVNNPAPPLPLSLISGPQRLYVRNEAPSCVPLMSPGRNGHSADYSSHMGTAGPYQGGQTDVYAAVASLLDRSHL